jgi:DNA repair photolyase
MAASSYKHAVSVSGQVFFCAAPIRLDAYDGCQFGCVYCFSRRRARRWASKGVHAANSKAFELRLKRVAAGNYLSALDEFLAMRVPIQLGGLHDPFTPREKSSGVTYRLLRILSDFNYPTLISTKGELVVDTEYVSLLRQMNVVVRFSAAGVAERFRAAIDRRCATFERTLEKIAALTACGIKTTLRIQPVVPGFEEDALRMTRGAALAGAKQVSFEYLKLPKETLRTDVQIMSDVIGFDILRHMKAIGLAEQGWDYALAPRAKRSFIIAARRSCHESGLRFGAGDTEFIPWSDGDGCCGSTSHNFHNSTQFRANYAGAIKSALSGSHDQVQFRSVEEVWSPAKPVSTYLDSSSRNGGSDYRTSDWIRLVAARWNGGLGPYSPAFFDGIRWTGKVDAMGFRIYDATILARSLASTG